MEESKSTGMDMLNGSMLDKILIFALPLAAGSILQLMFNAVDIAVVGNFGDSSDMAAVGANSYVVTMLVSLFVGISTGSNVVIARHIGSSHLERVSRALQTSMLFSIFCGLIMMVVGIIISRPLLSLMSTPDEVIDQAVMYLRIYCCGMPFILIYNFAAAALRSKGDTKKPLLCLITAGVTNACLNLFFVIVLHMTVSGVAIATSISNALSAAMALRFLYLSNDVVHFDPKNLYIDKAELSHILRIGLPAGVQGMIFSISNICIQTGINGFGADAIAGSTVACNFEFISYQVVAGFNSAVMTFVSQNYGAGNKKRYMRAYFLGLTCALVATFSLNQIFYLLRKPLIGIFTSNSAVAEYAVMRMATVMLYHFLISTYEVSGAALRGLGRSMVPTVLTIFGTCFFRILYVNTVAANERDFSVLLRVYPISWLITGTAVVTALIIVLRGINKIVGT